MIPWEPNPGNNLFILSVALMRAVRSAIHVTPNYPLEKNVLEIQHRIKEFYTKVDNISKEPKNLAFSSVPKYLERLYERAGKRTVQEGIGQCGEHVATVQNLIKLFPVPSIWEGYDPIMGKSTTMTISPPFPGKDVWCTVANVSMRNGDNHSLCLLYYSDSTFVGNSQKHEGRKSPSTIVCWDSAIICDSWLGYVFYYFHDVSNQYYKGIFGDSNIRASEKSTHTKLSWQDRGDQPWLERKLYPQAPNHLSYEDRVKKYERIYQPTINYFKMCLYEETLKAEQNPAYFSQPYIISSDDQRHDLEEYLRAHPPHAHAKNVQNRDI